MSLKRLASLGGSEAPIVEEKEREFQVQERLKRSPRVCFCGEELRSEREEKMVAFICCNPTVKEKSKERENIIRPRSS